jgi:hypothetical protein
MKALLNADDSGRWATPVPAPRSACDAPLVALRHE